MRTVTRPILSILLLIFFYTHSHGQSDSYAISWEASTQSAQQDLACYDITLTAPVASGAEVPSLLGSQNYRFYYDARQLRFRQDQSRSLLPSAMYSDLILIQDIHDSDARGFGSLDFDQHLSFINIAINDGGDPQNLVSLPSEAKIKSARVCFDNANKGDHEIIWSRRGVTDGYATAFTEISYYNGVKVKKAQLEYIDLESSSKSLQDASKLVSNKYD